MFLYIILTVYEHEHAVGANTDSHRDGPCVTVTRGVMLLTVLGLINLGT
jgi:hypothetical protein